MYTLSIRSVLNYVPRMPFCSTYLTCLCVLRAWRAFIFLRAFRAFIFLCALHALFFCVSSSFYVPYVSSFIYVPYVPSFLGALGAFIVLRALSVFIFTSLTCPHFYVPYVPPLSLRGLHDFNFIRAYLPWLFQVFPIFTVFYVPLPFFIKRGTTQNQPQQVGISKNEVE